MTEREEFSHALTIEIVRDIAKERGITLPILVDASGIRTFMITAYNEGFAAATAKADARIKELEKELTTMKDWEITLAKYAERANHWEKEARNISLAYDYAEATIAKREAELAALKSQEPVAIVRHEADILSLKNLVRECDEYKIRLSQAQESINYWMEAADEARAQVTIARIQEREACAQVCENGKGFDGDHPHEVFAAAIRARSGEMRKADFISSTPLREGWVSVPRDEYYLQDSRSYVGNDMLFWRLGGGYTTDLNKAEVFTKARAEAQERTRETDRPWLKSYIDSKSRHAVDTQYVSRKAMIAAASEEGI